MLNITFKKSENTLINVDAYFDFNYLDEWLEDDLVKEFIKDVDKSRYYHKAAYKAQYLDRYRQQSCQVG